MICDEWRSVASVDILLTASDWQLRDLSEDECWMGLGIDPTNDYVFRLAFGDPANSDLLIHLLNAILALRNS